MNVAAISTNSNSISSPFNNSNAIKSLEKQKAQLQEQIRKTYESKMMDDKTKQEKVKELQNQIQQIDMEIQQKHSEILTQKKPESTAANIQPNSGESNNLAGMSHLVQASASYSNTKIVQNTKGNFDNKSRILTTEIKLDEGRSPSGAPDTGKRAELQKMETRGRALDGKIGGTLKDANDEVKKSEKETVNKSKDQKNKDVQNASSNSKDKDSNYAKVDVRI